MSRYVIETRAGKKIVELRDCTLATAKKIGRRLAPAHGGKVQLRPLPEDRPRTGHPTARKARATKRRGAARSSRKRSSRRPRRNPVEVAPRELEQGKRAFARWNGFDATRAEVMRATPTPRVAVQLGEIHAIEYVSAKWTGRREKYRHVFHTPRPQLCTGPDSKGLIILGGGFKVTPRGIED